MKFSVERDALADAVAWTAKSLPVRPPVPILGGLLLDLEGSTLSVSGFDYEVSTQVDVEVSVATAGRVLVSGRLLADISRSLPQQPVDVVVEGPRATISCGSARFTLPTMPVEDYPDLPAMPDAVGTVASEVFAAAVTQVAVAAGRDDTLPMLTGVRMEIDGELVTLAATDRYRLAVREFTWTPTQPSLQHALLVPARTLADTAKALTGAELTIALSHESGVGSGEGMLGILAAGRRTTTRLLDVDFPKYQSLWPTSFSAEAQIPVAALTEALKRVSLVADRGTPVTLMFTEGGVSLTAGGEDEGRAEEQVPLQFSGEDVTVAFNPTFLLDGLSAVGAPQARLSLTSASKPAVIAAERAEAAEGSSAVTDYRYLIMPVRLPG